MGAGQGFAFVEAELEDAVHVQRIQIDDLEEALLVSNHPFLVFAIQLDYEDGRPKRTLLESVDQVTKLGRVELDVSTLLATGR